MRPVRHANENLMLNPKALADLHGDRKAPDGSLVRDRFAAWFGASQVVSKAGAPILAFHGTASDVQAFDPSRSNSKSKTGAPEGAFFFTDKSDVASSYTVSWQGDFSSTLHDSANVVPVYLSLKKPLKLSAKGESWREILFKGEFRDINDIAQMAKASGRYDGVIVSRVRDKGVGSVESKLSTTYIAFSALQIKSACGNSGAYDPEDPDITDRRALILALERSADPRIGAATKVRAAIAAASVALRPSPAP